MHSRDELDYITDVADLSTATLICFNTGIIIPARILRRLTRPAYNFHAASPDYPGRDPHHWAIYEGARSYGVTAHVMTEKVDGGPIVAIDQFDLPDGCTPEQLRSMAAERLFHLFERTINRMLLGPIRRAWRGPATTRKQLLAMCDLSGLDEIEANRRRRAFEGFPLRG